MRDAVVWYLAITLGLLGLLAVVVAVQSLSAVVRRTARSRVRPAVRRAAAGGRPAVDGWTSQPV